MLTRQSSSFRPWEPSKTENGSMSSTSREVVARKSCMRFKETLYYLLYVENLAFKTAPLSLAVHRR